METRSRQPPRCLPPHPYRKPSFVLRQQSSSPNRPRSRWSARPNPRSSRRQQRLLPQLLPQQVPRQHPQSRPLAHDRSRGSHRSLRLLPHRSSRLLSPLCRSLLRHQNDHPSLHQHLPPLRSRRLHPQLPPLQLLPPTPFPRHQSLLSLLSPHQYRRRRRPLSRPLRRAVGYSRRSQQRSARLSPSHHRLRPSLIPRPRQRPRLGMSATRCLTRRSSAKGSVAAP